MASDRTCDTCGDKASGHMVIGHDKKVPIVHDLCDKHYDETVNLLATILPEKKEEKPEE